MHDMRYTAAQQWGTDFTATSASGATFVNLTTHPADEVTILVPASGVALDILCAGQVAEPTKFVTVDAPSGVTISLCGDTKEIMVRRTDNSDTPVNVRFIWRKFRR